MLPKRGATRYLALIFIFLISCTPAGEIRAKPTQSSEIFTSVAQELSNATAPSENLHPKPADSTGAVILDEPKPKIDPKLVEELKQLKRERKHKRVKVLLEAEDEESLEKIREAVEKAGGKIEQSFSIGDVAVVELQSDKIEEVAEAAGVEQVSAEREYVALLADRIPAFSIDAAWDNNITGKNVKIAILDTGVGPHNSINVAGEASFVAGEDEKDQNGHGTHVAGIAQGVAKDASIYNAKVLNKNGGGTTSQILAGINWAVEQDVDVISMSFGGMFTELDGPLASAVKEAIQQGVVFVAAAGNCKQGCGGFYGVTTPGNVKEVISVGAVDDNNAVASFSSGDTFDGYIKPDVVAPGVDITSIWLNNGQATKSGTSMSTPFTAGIIALLLEKEPGLTQEQVKQRLEETATDAGSTGKDTSYGSGIVNVGALLSYAPGETLPTQESNDTALTPNVPANPENEIEALLPNLNQTTLVKIVDVEQTPGEQSQIAIYQTDNEQFVRVGYIEFKNAGSLQEFITKHVPYEETVKIAEQTAYRGANEPFIFWTHNTRYYWIVWDHNSLPLEENKVLATYIANFQPEGDYKFTKQDAAPLLFEASQTEANIFVADTSDVLWKIANNGCTDACDAQSYKTDLPTGTCHNQKNYVQKGTTYNDEWGCANTYTDSCTDSTTLKEYFLKCDDASWQWCSCQGFFCFPDKTYFINKACTDYGSNYICSSGKCVQGSSCDYSPTCTNEVQRQCVSPTNYDMSTATTACSGGCTGYTYQNTYSCGSGKYCQGTTYSTSSSPNLPCYTCSTACDGQCQSSACYQTDPDCTSSGGVNANACSCTLTSATWSTSGPVQSGTQVTLTVNGNSNCNGKSATFDIWEDDTVNDDYVTQITDNTFTSGKFSATWTTQWQSDGGTDPEFYFVATPSAGSSATSGLLSVTQATCTDNDGDGYGNPGSSSCSAGSQTDCNDSNANIKPGISETCGNNLDDNCNNQIDENCAATCTDNDGDGYGNPGSASCPSGGQSDCNDSNSNIKPGIAENCNTPFDDNCNNQANEGCPTTPTCADNDGDGYGNPGSASCSGGSQTDCNDGNAAVKPGITENCDNNIDDNCANGTNEGCCGNGICNAVETDTNCSTDCKGDLQVLSISAPSTADQGQSVTIQATIKNQGTYKHTLYGEAGIAPDYWQQYGYFMQGYDAQLSVDAQKCCTGNDFYAAKSITLNPGESQTVTFSVKAPSVSTIDSCWTVADRKSAWDTSHTAVVGLYKQCAGGYWSKKTQDIKVKDKQCYSNAECPSGAKCNLATLPGKCQLATCQNTCTDNSYTCKGDSIYQCKDANNDGCTENVYVKYCGAGLCKDGQSTCLTSNSATIKIEQSDGKIHAQKGDIITVHIKSAGDSIQLDYSSALTLSTSSCSGTFTVNGVKKCQFAVKETAQPNTYYIGIKNGQKADVVVITNPDVIVITDKQKLYSRFNEADTLSETTEVYGLLKQAYAYASSNRGVVYDLSNYATGNPWPAFGKYFESYNNPFIKDNTYSLKVVDFISSKCTSCKNTLILGDDFVVPHYRRKITLGGKEELIYSDFPYIKRTNKHLSELSGIFDKKKDVKIVVPDQMSEYLTYEVNRLKNTIKDKYFGNVDIIKSSAVACDSFTTLGSATLVLVGDDSNNNAISCLPFVRQLQSSITLERNVWDTDEYAVVLQPKYSEDVESARYDTILGFTKMVQEGANPEWKWSDTLIACLWDGKFDGSTHPTLTSVGCNIIPVVELIHDFRDSARCLTLPDKNWVERIVCNVTYGAAAYDGVTYLSIVGIVGGKLADIGVASAKAVIKEAAESLSQKLTKQALDNIEALLKSPQVLADFIKTAGKLGIKAMTNPKETIEGLLHILQHGKEIAIEALKYIRTNNQLAWTRESLQGVGYMKKIEASYGWQWNPHPESTVELGLGIFDEGLYNAIDVAKKEMGAFKDVQYIGTRPALGSLGALRDKGKLLAIDEAPAHGQSVKAFKEMLQKNVIFHEAGHSLFVHKYGSTTWYAKMQANYLQKYRGIDEMLADSLALSKLSAAKQADYISEQKKFVLLKTTNQLDEAPTLISYQQFVVQEFMMNVDGGVGYLHDLAYTYYIADKLNFPDLLKLQDNALDGRFRLFLKGKGYTDAEASSIISKIKSDSKEIAGKFKEKESIIAQLPDGTEMGKVFNEIDDLLEKKKVVLT
jgi:subtilisin family serine protease